MMPNDSSPLDVVSASIDWQPARITRVTVETPTVKRFVLSPERWHPFLAGQHVDVRLVAPDGYEARRSYSIASAPETRGVYELAVEVLNDGEVSPWFHDVAGEGDTVEIRGPFTEHFVWRGDEGTPVLMVGGGSGVAPLMSMLRHRAALAAPPPMTLLYSARTWDDVIFRDDLIRQEASQAGLRVILCLTREPARRPADFSRRIDAGVIADVLAAMPAPGLTFVCGANRFVESVARHLVSMGVAPPTIRTERYGGA